jgi:sporulation integral membrane protein YlbJ
MQIKYVSPNRTLQKRWGRLMSVLIRGLVIFCSLALSGEWAEQIRNGISLCLSTVIPSVFPFMVISSLITVLGAGRELGSVFYLPSRILFGTSRAAACAVFLGMVCGYPTGAISAAAMCDSGELSKSEAERLLTFINVPGAAFVIGAVGESMLGSKSLGVAIYLSVILSAFLSGVAGRLFFKPSPIRDKDVRTFAPDIPFSQAVTEAIGRSAKSMLNVSACVITFSALSGILCSLPSVTHAPQWIKALFTGFLEVSSGARAASLAELPLSPFLAASICSWSGLSVHMQIISVCRGRGISFFPFFISKAVQALMSPIILGMLLHFFD